jgi:hypothetical protein
MAKQKVTRGRTRTRTAKDPNELHLNEMDQQYYGSEPDFREDTITEENRQSKLGNALNWYSKIFDSKMSKTYVGQWLKMCNRTADLKLLSKVPDSHIVQTAGAMCRLAVHRGWVLSEKEEAFINSRVMDRVHAWHEENKQEQEEVVEKKPQRKSIQDVMLERTMEAGGEIDCIIDDFIHVQKAKGNADPAQEVVRVLNERNILPQHTNRLIDFYQKEKAEFAEAYSGKCEQLNEGYSNFTKTQLKNMINFMDKVISAISSYNTLKIKTRAKRKRTPVSVEKVVSKLKWQRSFVDEAANLKLESIHPKDLHLKKEAWVYDTAKRKLHHYVADSLGGELFIKGNTLCGFDPTASQIKTLRKPAEQIKQVMGSKPAARQFFDKIKSVAVQPKGRFNDNMIILKAF